MRIRSNQIDFLTRVREVSFCKQICVELRDEFPKSTTEMQDENLSQIVAKAIGKARNYEIVSGDGIRRFVKLAVLIDPLFDEVPEVQRLLSMPDLDPDLKIELLSNLTALHLIEKVS